MRKFKKLTFGITNALCLASLMGCASTLSLKSRPNGAKVFIREAGSDRPELLGETPLRKTSEELQLNSRRGPFVLTLEKDGYYRKDVLVTTLQGVDVDAYLDLDPGRTSAHINALIDQLFDAQALARSGKLKDALEALNKIEPNNTDVAALYELRGSVHLLLKDSVSAFKDYERCVKLNPSNMEAQKVFNSLGRTLQPQSLDRNSGEGGKAQ